LIKEFAVDAIITREVLCTNFRRNINFANAQHYYEQLTLTAREIGFMLTTKKNEFTTAVSDCCNSNVYLQ